MPVEGQLLWGSHVYLPTRFNPTEYSFTATEINALLAQVPALRAVNSLYALQAGGQRNMDLWNAVDAAAKSGAGTVADYRLRVLTFGGFFDSSGTKFKPEFGREAWEAALAEARQRQHVPDIPYDELARDEEPPTGADVFVNETQMPKEEVARWGQGRLDAIQKTFGKFRRWAMQDPMLNMSTRARLVSDGAGGYTVIEKSWQELYPDLVRTAADSFVAAGEICEATSPAYAAILNATAVGFETGNYLPRDILLSRNDSRLYTFAGLTERIGDGLGWDFVNKNAFDAVIAVVDQNQTAEYQKLAQLAPILVKELPKELRNPNLHPPVLHALRILYEAGISSHAGSSIAARKWPNFPADRITADTCTYVVDHGDTANRAKYLLMPTARVVLHESEIPGMEDIGRYSKMFDAGHELFHAVGLKRIEHSALEEGRPSAGAIWQAERLLGSKEEADRYCKAILPMLVRFVRAGLKENGEVTGDFHAKGTNALVNMIFENGGAKLHGGKVEVEPVGMRKAAGEYCVEGTRLLAGGDQKPIDAFFEPHKVARKETIELIAAMKAAKIPRTFVRDRGTVDEFEAALRACLP